MSLSTSHLNTNTADIPFDRHELGRRLAERLPEAIFCLLHGSAKDGVVRPGSDLDVAFYLKGPPTMAFFDIVEEVVARTAPGARVDVGVLNRAEPVHAFESLGGDLLFCRDMDAYAAFFSLSCRRYEDAMASYRRQYRYRKEANHAV